MKDDKHVLEMRPQDGGWNVMDLDTGEVDAVIASLKPVVAKHVMAGTLPASIGMALLNLAVQIFRVVYGDDNAVVNLRAFADAIEEDGDFLETEPPAGNA